jgi:hypothetical protein
MSAAFRRKSTAPSGPPVMRMAGFCVTLVTACAAWSAESLPADARSLIREVRAAAQKSDLAALRRLMVQEFQWSFGGDRDREQALAAWAADPQSLRHLTRVAGEPCGFITAQIIQCPRRGGIGYRAGFERTGDGWRMSYFVAGD